MSKNTPIMNSFLAKASEMQCSRCIKRTQPPPLTLRWILSLISLVLASCSRLIGWLSLVGVSFNVIGGMKQQHIFQILQMIIFYILIYSPTHSFTHLQNKSHFDRIISILFTDLSQLRAYYFFSSSKL